MAKRTTASNRDIRLNMETQGRSQASLQSGSIGGSIDITDTSSAPRVTSHMDSESLHGQMKSEASGNIDPKQQPHRASQERYDAANEDKFQKYVVSQERTWTGAYTNSNLESQYMTFVVREIRNWYVTTLILATTLLAVYYCKGMYEFPEESAIWRRNYSVTSIPPDVMRANMTAYCPKGYFCETAPAQSIISDYYIWKDALLLLSSASAAALAIGLCKKLSAKRFAALYNVTTCSYILITGCVTFIIRDAFIAPKQNITISSMALLFWILGIHTGLPLRYLHTVCVHSILFVIWFVACFISEPLDENVEPVYKRDPEGMVSSAIILALTVATISIISTRQERIYRLQFLRSQFSTKINSKLTYQLRALQKAYTTGNLDLESPLEKSIYIIKSLMADPSLASEQLANMESVLQLLNSPQLLQPDFERQFAHYAENANDTGAVDNEQKAWLLNEISKRRADPRRKYSSVSRRKRKMSVYGTVPEEKSMEDTSKIPQVPTVPEQYTDHTPGRRRSSAKPISTGSRSNRQSMDGGSYNSSSEQSVVLYNKDPFTYSNARYNMEHSQGIAKRVVDLATESIAGSLMQIPRPSDVTLKNQYNPEVLQSLLNSVNEWNWKIFDFADACPGGKPLFIMTWHFFDINGLFDELNLPLDKFNNFMWKIQEGYRDLPYHNSIHAADVLHAVNYFVQFDKISNLVSSLELTGIYIAAAIHDFDHPGVNNNFLVTTHNPLAILYNDKAVLECYHVSTAFQLLMRADNDFLAHLPKADMQPLREMIIDMVLATDLGQHYATLSSFKTRLQNSFNPAESKEDRALLFKMLIKCADVSNPTKTFSTYFKWTHAVLEEWRTQGDQERSLNIPISPFMDRNNPNVLISSQSGFIDFIISPMFETFHTSFMSIPTPMEELENNKRYWMRIKEQKDADQANGMPSTTIAIIRKSKNMFETPLERDTSLSKSQPRQTRSPDSTRWKTTKANSSFSGSDANVPEEDDPQA